MIKGVKSACDCLPDYIGCCARPGGPVHEFGIYEYDGEIAIKQHLADSYEVRIGIEIAPGDTLATIRERLMEVAKDLHEGLMKEGVLK